MYLKIKYTHPRAIVMALFIALVGYVAGLNFDFDIIPHRVWVITGFLFAFYAILGKWNKSLFDKIVKKKEYNYETVMKGVLVITGLVQAIFWIGWATGYFEVILIPSLKNVFLALPAGCVALASLTLWGFGIGLLVSSRESRWINKELAKYPKEVD